MPYRQEISRQNKALFIFLLDQSFSMTDPLAGGERKIDQLVLAMNAWLQNMVIVCGKSEGLKDWFDICIMGYRTDSEANPIIEPALGGVLAGRVIVSISDIANNTARMETITALIPDEETGEMLPMPQQMPVWVDAKTEGATPICSAIVKACEIIDNWIPQHETSFPPIVINITDGEATDGDPLPYAEALRQRETKDGNVLFFNCCLSATPADPFLFRGNGELMPDAFARQLFEMSSILPESMVNKARDDGQDLEANARGMAYNADMVSLIKFLEMGTRAALR